MIAQSEIDSAMRKDTPASHLTREEQDVELVSIIIPAYNYAQFLPHAVQSALEQTYQAIEVIVVDDGSTDNTFDVLGPWMDRIHYHRKINGGLSAARNTGTELAKGAFVVYLDADDMLLPTMVEECMTALRRWPRPVNLVATRAVIMNKQGEAFPGKIPDLLEADREISRDELVVTTRFPVPCLIRKEALNLIGGFDTNLKSTEDRDAWIKLAEQGTILCLSRALSYRRIHGENMSAQAEKQTATMRAVLRRSLSVTHPLPRRYLLAMRAWSSYYWSSARLFRDSKHPFTALWHVTLSLLLWPWYSSYDQYYLGGYQKPFFRVAFVLVTCYRLPRLLTAT